MTTPLFSLNNAPLHTFYALTLTSIIAWIGPVDTCVADITNDRFEFITIRELITDLTFNRGFFLIES